MKNKKRKSNNKVNKSSKSSNSDRRKQNNDEEIIIGLGKQKNNNSKENIEKNKNSKKKKKDKKRNIKRIFVLTLIILFVLLIMFLISLYKWNQLIKDLVKLESSVVLDSTGNVIAVLGETRIQENIKIQEVPDNLKNAYISIEDKNFYKHCGINFKRTIGAIGSYIINVGSSSYGGSTITQQLVKNLTGENETKVSRKVTEWDRAIKTELVMSKDEILETYFNIIYVGPNVYGVKMGAKYYFDKELQDLTLAECAYLAGLNHSPNSYNPFGTADNSEKIKKRSTTVLSVMLQEGYISQEQYDSAVEELSNGLNFKKGDVGPKGSAVYSYMVDAVISDTVKDLAEEKEISTSFATNYLYYSGLKIYSTQNSDIQKEIENEFAKEKYMIKSTINEGVTTQAAMIIIDHKTGRVVGCVGGLGDKTTSRGFNRATQALRQTGSAIKPIAVVGPALEENIITPVTIYDDVSTVFADGYEPKNYDTELGEITVRRALESSQNIPFVKIIEQLTPAKSIEYLKRQGITTLTEQDNNLVLALGGLEDGITPLQMSVAYGAIANGGKYIEPTFYDRIENSKGKIILKPHQNVDQVYSADTSYILKQMLTQPVVGTYGTAKNCTVKQMEVAAKTGTTNDNYDKWLCGFTEHYTGVVWYGYDSNESISEKGLPMANQMWANVMNAVHKDLIKVNFPKVDSVKEINVCKKSGKMASEKCKNVYLEFFRESNCSLEVCSECM